MFEPKYTGLANRDAGDFAGEVSFIFMTFQARQAANPEADITDNVFERSTVNVTGFNDRGYLRCNAPGANQSVRDSCPITAADYCCSNTTELTKDSLPGRESRNSSHHHSQGIGGYWYSFPKAAEGNTWTEKVERRIKSRCLADAWRSDAGGCPDCGADLDQCVASCIQSKLITNGNNYTALMASWDRAFSDKHLCPDQPFPGVADVVVV